MITCLIHNLLAMSSSAIYTYDHMEGAVALVSCGGKWVFPTRDQLAVITLGQNATQGRPQPEPYTSSPRGNYEYVIRADGRGSYVMNIYTGKCREVMILPSPPPAWDEAISHPPRGF